MEAKSVHVDVAILRKYKITPRQMESDVRMYVINALSVLKETHDSSGFRTSRSRLVSASVADDF